MKMFYFFSSLVVILSVTSGAVSSSVPRVAVAHLSTDTVQGAIVFTETKDGVHVTGRITGMPPNRYGFHIHELGDVGSCADTGAHFNPRGVNHGGRDHGVRHVGDLGNVEFTSDTEKIAVFNFTDKVISLRGGDNILGRGVVLHAQEDDLGLGGHNDSLTTGNAGARVACAVIGMHAPVEAWNSSETIVITKYLLLLITLLSLRNTVLT